LICQAGRSSESHADLHSYGALLNEDRQSRLVGAAIVVIFSDAAVREVVGEDLRAVVPIVQSGIQFQGVVVG